MQGQTFVEDPRLTLAQAARILGVSRQAVLRAVERGTLRADGPPHHRRVRLSHVIAYGVRNGRNAELLLKKAQKEISQPVDWANIAALVLGILGVVILAELFKSKRETPKQEPQKTAV